MAKEQAMTIAFRSGRTINGEYYGPKADKSHQTWTASPGKKLQGSDRDELSLAYELVDGNVAYEVKK